jgi:hypothetical protein
LPGGSASERRYARVNLGRFAADPAARGFTAYAVSRTEATLARDVTLPSLVRSTGPRYRAFLAGEYRTLRKNNWTTAAPTRWAVLALSRQSTAASLRACFWGPSTSYLDARTRKPVEDLDNRWYATRVQMSKQGVTWRVDDVQLSTFSCKARRREGLDDLRGFQMAGATRSARAWAAALTLTAAMALVPAASASAGGVADNRGQSVDTGASVARVNRCTLYASSTRFGAKCAAGASARARTWRQKLAGRPLVTCHHEPVPDGVELPPAPSGGPGTYYLQMCIADFDVDRVGGGDDAHLETELVWIPAGQRVHDIPPWMTWLWASFTATYPTPLLTTGPTATRGSTSPRTSGWCPRPRRR